jgi:Mannose-6-phosphate isomerase
MLPIGSTHRLANPGKIALELIEVQTGSYFGGASTLASGVRIRLALCASSAIPACAKASKPRHDLRLTRRSQPLTLARLTKRSRVSQNRAEPRYKTFADTPHRDWTKLTPRATWQSWRARSPRR